VFQEEGLFRAVRLFKKDPFLSPRLLGGEETLYNPPDLALEIGIKDPPSEGRKLSKRIFPESVCFFLIFSFGLLSFPDPL